LAGKPFRLERRFKYWRIVFNYIILAEVFTLAAKKKAVKKKTTKKKVVKKKKKR
jgi:hypothetical protein